MSFGKLKLRKSDRLFTKLVRIIYGYTCQRCGKEYSPDGDLHNLGVSHYWVRSREATRFDLDNITLLCNIPCHTKWAEEDRDDYKAYMIKRLGQRGFDLLMLRAHLYCKRDDFTVELVLKAKIKELKGG